MRRDLFTPTPDGVGRLLLLIDAFSAPDKSLEGRTKLAKLDFFLRYPHYLKRALEIERHKRAAATVVDVTPNSIERRMLRFRFGPWDPAYFALLGQLIGRGLVLPVPETRGVGYRTTSKGRELAARLALNDAWSETAQRSALLRRHFDRTGTSLKEFVYRHFPEVSEASWLETL